ncbi:hypothetical protein OQA88_1163 [Cercophora sp. LCS_1]
MSPARVDDSVMMFSDSRKRSAEAEADGKVHKKQRVLSANELDARVDRFDFDSDDDDFDELESSLVTAEELARAGMRRGIALTLSKVGFEGASPDAMESFIAMAETYLASMVQDVKSLTNAARRTHPIPTDFEHVLKRYNLTTGLLDPHRKPPIPRSKRIPTYEPLEMDDEISLDLPVLGDELNGAPDKESKSYIPSSFPAFPSTHTYKYTPETVEAVAVLKELPPSEIAGSQKPKTVEWPLAPHEIPYGDPKKLREAAAKEARAGEEALRKLMRASKVASQKESWASAQREPARKERYDLWESAMRELIEEDVKSKGQEIEDMHGEKGREGIADYSMIVNSEKIHYRRETARASNRKMPISIDPSRG